MANRTIVSIEPSFEEDSWQMRLLKAPLEIPDARKPERFAGDPEGFLVWDGDDAVRKHGQRLFAELEKHPAIKEALADLRKVAPGQAHSFYLHLVVEAAERLCWEALCLKDGKFLSLDARWPIARIADSVADRHSPMYRFEAPLKVMALLSALKQPAKKEWEALKEAVLAARAANFEIELFVLVGEQDLLDDIKAEIANGTLPDVVVEPMPDRTSELERLIDDRFRPHVMHFFCHGSASHGVARLELATILDWMDDKSTGSLKVDVDTLLGMTALQEVWLVTLNCCEGGRAQENAHSMAHRLVANGVPAAVGVLEPLDAGDAHDFCAAFYPAIFKKLHELTRDAPDDAIVDVEWADALRPPRTNISEKYGLPAQHREWALPVMYVRPEPFRLHIKQDELDPAKLNAMRLKAGEIARSLAALPPNTPVEFRQALLDLLAEVPANMKPDLYGKFSDTQLAEAHPIEELEAVLSDG